MQSSFDEDYQHAAGRARRHDQTVANLHTGRANCLGRSGEIVDAMMRPAPPRSGKPSTDTLLDDSVK